MADIFISYARKDEDMVQPIIKLIESNGWSVFWDRNIYPGEEWPEYIEKELDEARCVVVVWSLASVRSRWVKIEAREGRNRNILVPIRIEKIAEKEIPLEFRHIQHEDMSLWQKGNINYRVRHLIEAIESVLSRPISISADTTTKISPKPRASTSEKVTVDHTGKQKRDARKQLKTNPKTFTNAIGMEFILIPNGSFKMGSDISPEEVVRRYGGEVQYFEHEQPQHLVTIRKPFYLQTTLVTQGQWKKVMGNNPSNFGGRENHPVESVSWNDAQKYIQKLNELEGLSHYRLPTEAEWEYACRAGTTTEFSFGNDEKHLDKYCWYNKNSHRETGMVKTKTPNPWGLYDMHGNVWEWVEDFWHDNYEGAPNDGSAWIDNPTVPKYNPLFESMVKFRSPEDIGILRPTPPSRMLRGGSWFNPARICRSAYRTKDSTSQNMSRVGFRLAMSIDP